MFEKKRKIPFCKKSSGNILFWFKFTNFVSLIPFFYEIQKNILSKCFISWSQQKISDFGALIILLTINTPLKRNRIKYQEV